MNNMKEIRSLTVTGEEIDKLLDKIRKKMYYFEYNFNKHPSKIYLDGITYKKIERSYEVYSLYYYTFKPTLFGMDIEVIPGVQEFIEFGCDDIGDNVEISFRRMMDGE